jgi:molecular chaperone HscB
VGDPFAELGVPRRFGLPMKEVAQRHRDLSRTLHPDRHANASPAERRVALERAVAVNEAWRVIRDPLARALALLDLHGAPLRDADRATPALLMEVMELREALESARGDAAAIAPLRAQVQAHIAAEEGALAEALDGDAVDAPALQRARDAAVKLKYYRRFEEEAEAMEE